MDSTRTMSSLQPFGSSCQQLSPLPLTKTRLPKDGRAVEPGAVELGAASEGPGASAVEPGGAEDPGAKGEELACWIAARPATPGGGTRSKAS